VDRFGSGPTVANLENIRCVRLVEKSFDGCINRTLRITSAKFANSQIAPPKIAANLISCTEYEVHTDCMGRQSSYSHASSLAPVYIENSWCRNCFHSRATKSTCDRPFRPPSPPLTLPLDVTLALRPTLVYASPRRHGRSPRLCRRHHRYAVPL
jgi:hypothetical protein